MFRGTASRCGLEGPITLVVLIVAAFVVLVTSGGCASQRNIAAEVCELHTEYRPKVVAVRAAIAEKYDTFDAETQAKLRDVDANVLPKLDKVGAIACQATVFTFDWGSALKILVESAGSFADLKSRGVF